jgi:hypothetical protein
MSVAYLVHNNNKKKMNVHIIDSNSVMKKSNTTAKVMSNTD